MSSFVAVACQSLNCQWRYAAELINPSIPMCVSIPADVSTSGCVCLHGGTAQSKKNHLPRNKQVQSGRFKKTNNCIMCSSYCPRYWQWFSGWTLEQGLLEKCLSRRPWSESSSGRCRTDKRDTPVGALRSTWGAHWFGRIIIGRHELATNL